VVYAGSLLTCISCARPASYAVFLHDGKAEYEDQDFHESSHALIGFVDKDIKSLYHYHSHIARHHNFTLHCRLLGVDTYRLRWWQSYPLYVTGLSDQEAIVPPSRQNLSILRQPSYIFECWYHAVNSSPQFHFVLVGRLSALSAEPCTADGRPA
jgi:hypothetical protein